MATSPHMIERTCEKCGVVFRRYRSQKPKFCSWECARGAGVLTNTKQDLLGKRFGRLMVVSPGESRQRGSGKGTFTVWNCVCDCGKEHSVLASNLVQRYTKSCGCLQLDLNRQRRARSIEKQAFRLTARQARDQVCRKRLDDPAIRKATSLWRGARKRSKAQGLPCTITVDEVASRLRETNGLCPILGTPFRGHHYSDSPSIDKLIPALGYTFGNIRIISRIANTWKNDAPPEVIHAMSAYIHANVSHCEQTSQNDLTK